MGYDFTEAAISAPRLHTPPNILRIQYSYALINPFDQSLRPVNCMQILVEPHGDHVTKVGTAMEVGFSLKEPTE